MKYACYIQINITSKFFQAQRGIQVLSNAGGGIIDLHLVPYDLLTDREKKKNRERCQELLKYIQYQSYNLHKTKGDSDRDRAAKNPDNRFANNFLDRLIMYLDSSAPAMKILKPSNNFTRDEGYIKLFAITECSVKCKLLLETF